MPGDSETAIAAPSQAAIDSVQKLHQAILSEFPQAVADFETRWDAWLAASSTESSESSSIDACTRTSEYESLKKLGPKTIPLVVSKLAADPEKNSRGVFLYNELETFSKFRPSSDSPQTADQLRQQATEIVELNFTRNTEAEDAIKAWMDHYESYRYHLSSTAVFTQCEEYYDLLGMDQGIIAHLMVAYCKHPDAYYYELLHDLTHGRQMGAHAVHKPACFEAWKKWFNEGEHDQRPKYLPTDADRKIYGDAIAGYD